MCCLRKRRGSKYTAAPVLTTCSDDIGVVLRDVNRLFFFLGTGKINTATSHLTRPTCLYWHKSQKLNLFPELDAPPHWQSHGVADGESKWLPQRHRLSCNKNATQSERRGGSGYPCIKPSAGGKKTKSGSTQAFPLNLPESFSCCRRPTTLPHLPPLPPSASLQPKGQQNTFLILKTELFFFFF